MIRWMTLTLAAALGSCFTPLAYSGIEGNGGDVVVCRPSAASGFNGTYSLDYLATFRLSNGNSDIVAAPSWEASRDRLSAILRAKSPVLAASFDRFIDGMSNFTDFAAERVWIEKSFGLVDLADERLINKLPANCYEIGADSKPKIIQTVRRERKEGVITYFFDSDIYDALRRDLPLQFSFLIVHEWLWDLTRDLETIRTVNRILHSSTVDAYTPEQLNLALARIGLNFSANPGFVPVCERSRPIRLLLEVRLGKSCQDMTATDLSSISELRFSGTDIQPSALQGGDFSGMSSLTSIYLWGFQINDLPDGLFYNAPSLAFVDLSNMMLKRFNRRAFPSSISLTSLSLDYNELTSVDLEGMDVKTVTLTFNKIASTNSIKLGRTEVLSLSENPISIATEFPSGSSLRWLSIGTSELTQFDCSSVPNLQSLNISGAKAGFRIRPSMFAGCWWGLRNLWISSIPNIVIDPNAFSWLLNLETFALNRTQLTNLPAGLLTEHERLREIELNFNQFDHTLADILPRHEIEALSLTGNKFEFLPAWFSEIKIHRKGYVTVWNTYNGALRLNANPLAAETRRWLETRFAYLGAWLEI